MAKKKVDLLDVVQKILKLDNKMRFAAIIEKSGKIITIENNPDKIKRANVNFQKSGLSKSIIIKEGEAMEILKVLNTQEKNNGFFDLVLIDADKENIIEYFDLILPMVSPGGLIITDNMLYPEK